MRMAALLLHQACEHLYQCLTWTLKLHGRRTHSLDELRGLAEAEHEKLEDDLSLDQSGSSGAVLRRSNVPMSRLDMKRRSP